ncbi:MAG: TetR/AcrR family transcriptional regulator [Faecalibacterium sp.]|nr:TetR/AcrR family transcriptional regulator [Faecalibacterium sp.]MDD6630431.1 TetR/AcrR family transcriptional regulator [Faecalibacterium sp.]MDY4157324.1 TetR/AcrR family transcriptional regulator [Faecalibacterium sp.]
MNPMATSKENILQISRKLIQQNGWAGVNIRSVAAACGVSVGCIYNYFESKTDLLSATVESIWSDIFHHPEDEAVFQDTLSCVRWMYKQLEYGCQRYPGFFTHHALGFVQQDTADGKQQMQRAWQHILDALCTVLRNDARIRADAFTEEFTVEKFAEMLFSLMLSALVRQDFDPSTVLEIVRRAVY